jgi:ABC-2 type transport system permease protein
MTDTPLSSAERQANLSTAEWQDAGVTGTLFRGTAVSVRDIWQRRELLGMLTRRELKSRYKDSTLGFLWSLARPLTQLLIYYLVVGQFLHAARGIDNFAVYIFSGLTIYTLFNEIIQTGTGSIIANSGLVKKVYLPREIFPLATIGSALFNFLIQLLILIVASVLLGTVHLGPDLLFAVGALAIVIIYGTALILVLSAINVFLRDVQYLVEVVLLLLMWGSPIVYSLRSVAGVFPNWLLQIYIANPVTIAVLGFHIAFWSPTGDGISAQSLAVRMVLVGLFGLVLVFGAQRLFTKLSGNFAQEL